MLCCALQGSTVEFESESLYAYVVQALNNEAEEAETGRQQNKVQGRAVQDKKPLEKFSEENADSTKGSSGR